MSVKIENKQIDICPLCNKHLDPKKENCTKVELGGEMLFYAHLGCIKTLNIFLSRARKEL